MSEAPFVESKLLGFFEPGFVSQGRVTMRLGDRAEGQLTEESTPPVRIDDARRLQGEAQARGSFSEASFFQENGFVLLPHESAVADWDVDTTTPGNELSRVYEPEVDAMIRTRLLPGRPIVIWQAPLARRGPGTASPEYAAGVHQDFGVTPDDYEEAVAVFSAPEIGEAWRRQYDREDVVGFVALDFWRTAGMGGPLRHMPLGFCHPGSVRVDDVVPLGLFGFSPTGEPTSQSGLCWDDRQRWYYYPEMTPSEVLVFKQFQLLKDDPTPRVRSCFHSAFELPDTPPDAEPRQSSEHRVLVFLLES